MSQHPAPRPRPGWLMLVLMLALGGCRDPGSTPGAAPGRATARRSTMLTESEAIAIARRALVGKVTPQDGAPVVVDTEGDRLIVTFVHHNPPGVRGPDYDARVTLDRRSGRVLEILGGP